MKKLATMSLLLVIALVSISAYLRLDSSGIGCADWPHCYGLIGAQAATEPSIQSTYQRLAEEAQQPLSWARPAHRLLASVLGLTVLAMALLAVRRRQDRIISLLLLGLTVFLAWLGIHSSGLHSPAVVMGNLSGGFLLLGLLGWMSFRRPAVNPQPSAKVTGWVIAALLMVSIQIGFGGLTSANFAASACQTLPDCHGSYLPGTDLAKALDLTRAHEIGATGLAIGGEERADIHKLHRIAAVVTILMVLAAAVAAFRENYRLPAVIVVTIVAAEFAIGIAAVATQLPIGLAVAHNWLAAMLILGLLYLLAQSYGRKASGQ